MGILVRPVAQYQRILRKGVLRSARRGAGPLADNERPVQAALLLKAAVGMVPVRAVLDDGKSIGMRGVGLHGRGSQVRHPVLVIGHQQAVPVEGSLRIHQVMHPYHGGISLREIQGGAWNAPVDAHGRARYSREIDRSIPDIQIVLHRFCLDTRSKYFSTEIKKEQGGN